MPPYYTTKRSLERTQLIHHIAKLKLLVLQHKRQRELGATLQIPLQIPALLWKVPQQIPAGNTAKEFSPY